MSTYSDVRDFHVLFGRPARARPVQLPRHELALRLRLIAEEFCELVEALVGHDSPFLCMTVSECVNHAALHAQPYDAAEVAKEAVDLKYVVNGTGVQAGIDIDAAWRVVHESNMAKVGPHGEVLIDADGKILKPPGWWPPDVAAAIGLGGQAEAA